jgi:3-phenylpropionate/trans-cinnamate dioxygenase ferredoxin reductase subunit
LSVAGVVVVGGSLAGLRAAEALRRGGHDGPLTVVGEEAVAPYDRPPLSKQVLTGKATTDSVALRREEGLDIEWRLGCRATALDLERRRLALDDGEDLAWSALVIATGARVRYLPGTGDLQGIHVLRTLDDAIALRADLQGNPRVAVIGGGFIGSEVASSCRTLGLDVTVVDTVEVPLARALGDEMGRVAALLHHDNGTVLLTQVAVQEVVGTGRVEGLRLTGGRVVPADVVVVGIGVTPVVDWLEGSGVDLGNGVHCDKWCRVTAGGVPVPGVVAAGDVAHWEHPGWAAPARVEHWTNAVEQGEAAAHTLLHGQAAKPYAPTPYFWSDQYGKKIQFVGQTLPGDEVMVVDGSIEARRFVALYGRHGRMVGALGMSRPARVMHYQREIAAGAVYPPTSEDATSPA